MNKILALIVLFAISCTAIADTQFIKYRNYLIPVGVATIVETSSAINIRNFSATLRLTLQSGEDDTLVWFQTGTVSELVCANPNSALLSSRIDAGDNYDAPLGALIADTNYFFRACAIDEQGVITQGDVLPFTTTNTPVVQSRPQTSLTNSSAVLQGQLTAGRNIDTWFVYSTSRSVACGSAPPSGASLFQVSRLENFSLLLNNLLPETDYFYRACVRSNTGRTDSGLVVNFTTDNH